MIELTAFFMLSVMNLSDRFNDFNVRVLVFMTVLWWFGTVPLGLPLRFHETIQINQGLIVVYIITIFLIWVFRGAFGSPVLAFKRFWCLVFKHNMCRYEDNFDPQWKSRCSCCGMISTEEVKE